MQLKVESENSERNGTSSIYISQQSPSPASVVSEPSNKPVLTIQVNQNLSGNHGISNENANNNLVNIVSCFRAYPTAANGIGNVVVHNGNNAAIANVSVNRNCCNDESVNNENNQNIVNVECRQSTTFIKREDLNEISVDVTADANSNVDYQNMALDSVTNRDRVGLIESEMEKIVIATAPTTGTAVNQISETQIAVDGAKDTQQREQRRRERRERRQARHRAANQHAHRHHRAATAVVHQRAVNNRGAMTNGAEQPLTRANYEMLPDIINNHLPPPYTTLPHHQLPPPPNPHNVVPTPAAIHSPPLIAATVPVVVDDCRFSFPIPIIRR
jgi:hypothetical protein